MSAKIKLRRDTAANWSSVNPTLALGEPGLETDTNRVKFGNGTLAWADLPYSSSDWNDILNKPTFFSGLYDDLTNKPTLFSGAYADLTGAPTLATVATSGSYDDLSNKPALFSGSYTDLTNTPTLFSGSYDDLTNKPTLPDLTGYATETYVTQQVSNLIDSAPGALNTLNELAAALNDDSSFASNITTIVNSKISKPTNGSGEPVNGPGYLYNDGTGTVTWSTVSYNLLTDKPTLFSGSYNDLTNTPTIPADVSDLTDTTGLLGSGATTGDITFSGVKVIGAGTASGDGAGYSTIELVPDNNLYTISTGGAFGTSGGQYLVIDPTSPQHIHIRAGGPQDQAAAQLILGGEKANVTVRDQDNSYTENHWVTINAQSNLGDTYSWEFKNNGGLEFPDNTTQTTAFTGNSLTAGTSPTTYTLSVAATGPINIPTASTGKGRLQNADGIEILTNSGATAKLWSFNDNGSVTFPDASVQTSAFVGNADTINVTNTNGLTTVYYPTFVENRDGAEALRADVDLTYRTDTNTLTAGNISSGGTITATGKIGYASGSSVTQATNRGQGVTINALAGTIVTTSDTIAAGDADYFFVGNSEVDPATDIVLVQVTSYNPGTYLPIAQPTATPFNGFMLSITNISAFASPTETVTVRFMVMKSPNQ